MAFMVNFILPLVVGLTFLTGAISLVGTCYVMLGDDLPNPEEVVSLYKLHHIKKIRLYEPSHSVFHALRHSNIDVLVGVSKDIKKLANLRGYAKKWVEEYVEAYWVVMSASDILLLEMKPSLGNEAISGPESQNVFPAMKNLQTALNNAGFWKHIKVSTIVDTSVMGVTYPPSFGAFSNDTVQYMKTIVHFLVANGAPLLANVYPYFSHIAYPERISSDYALFLSKEVVLQDGDLGYQSLFDEVLDAFYAALEKVGVPHLSVLVSETGWPAVKNHSIAQIYNSNLVKHALSSQGTPKRRGIIAVYLYAMFQEKKKGVTTKNWGLFYPNKQPVYPLKFA